MNQVIKEFKDAIKEATTEKTSAYDTTAEVVRVEGSTAWVHIPDGVDETPVKMTIDAKEGDNVQVRVSGGRAWLTGNATSPPTDDTTAKKANTTAKEAKQLSDIAYTAAESAVADAGRAASAAARAEQSATDAQTSANNALASAQNASEYASRALGNLSTVQSVAETLTWITQHGTMALTTDVALDPTHVYFVVDPLGDYEVGGTHYSIVVEPNIDDIGTYYELSIDESLNNYVGTHLALTQEGLWLLPASSGTNKVLIATGAGTTYTTAGTYILNSSGGVEASFRSNGATIGQIFNGYSRTEIGTDGMQIVQRANGSDTQIANLGYGLGNTTSGTANAPYYTLGTRKTTSTAYSSSSTYAVGDMCVYNNELYVCTTAITTAEAWTSSHWKLAVGNYSVAEGEHNTATGAYSHAEGFYTMASGEYSHAEGSGILDADASGIIASGFGSHAEGCAGYAGSTSTIVASGEGSHAEGCTGGAASILASGYGSHAEGLGTTASNFASHAEGNRTTASGSGSHAEGYQTTASGIYSHAQNYYTIANGYYQTALGKYNVADTTSAVIIGRGVADNARANALTVDFSGNVVAAGGLTLNNNASAIGTIKSSNASATTVATGTNTRLTSISLEAGTWIITGGVRFPNNGTGFRRMNISTTKAAEWADVQLPAVTGASTQLFYTVIVSINSTTTYYLNCYHNAGTSLSLIGGGGENGINFLRAIRIV